MKDSLFKNYSKNHVHFYDEAFPAFLELGFDLISNVEKPSIVDLGCGDGRLLFALYKKGLLNGFSEIVGVDISMERIGRVAKALPFVKGVVSDATNVKDYPSSFFDYVICSQLIEHVHEDFKLLLEIRRLLKENGLLFISSVIKKPFSFWFYRRDGTFRLDPTHTREYTSSEAFLQLLRKEGFNPIHVYHSRINYSFIDLLLRGQMILGFYTPEGLSNIFLKNNFLKTLRRIIRLPIIGYKRIDVLASMELGI